MKLSELKPVKIESEHARNKRLATLSKKVFKAENDYVMSGGWTKGGPLSAMKPLTRKK